MFAALSLKKDLPASIVVFIVALPLCLGIALASGAPLFSGVIAGIIGGIVVGSMSGSNVSVSGPAAGLTVIVAAGITTLGDYRLFLMAVSLAGLLQIGLGMIKAGSIGNFFPSAVIKGMLTAIGIILILKQIPHAFGIDHDPEGDEEFIQPDGENTFTELFNVFDYSSLGTTIIAVVSLTVLLLWDRPFIKKTVLGNIPASLMAVLSGTIVCLLYPQVWPTVALTKDHMVDLPVAASIGEFMGQFTLPSLAAFANVNVYVIAFTLAVVASLESLLSIEASDKLDPNKRRTPLNRELIAQGMGNVVSGLIGGLPVTSVIVRSSVNISAGAHSKWSAISHGGLLLVCVALIPGLLNHIPLASLAVILIVTGYKLAKPALFRAMYEKGWSQFIPFVITVVAILLSDLLIGIAIGMVAGFAAIMITNYHTAILYTNDGDKHIIRFVKDVTFVNKAILRKLLDSIPHDHYVLIDTSRFVFVDHDIEETLEEFIMTGPDRNLRIEMRGKGQPIAKVVPQVV